MTYFLPRIISNPETIKLGGIDSPILSQSKLPALQSSLWKQYTTTNLTKVKGRTSSKQTSKQNFC